MGREPGRLELTAYLRADVSAYAFWKRRTNTMFDIRISNLDAVSNLCMTPKKYLTKAYKDKRGI